MVSVLKDEVKDALFRKASKCTRRNAIGIRALRRGLYLAQSVFADVLGVSTATVVAWENGANTPSPMACRLMELIEAYPDVLLEAGVVEVNAGGDLRHTSVTRPCGPLLEGRVHRQRA